MHVIDEVYSEVQVVQLPVLAGGEQHGMSLVAIHLEHGGGEEEGGGGVLQLLNVMVADTLGGVVRKANERTALAVASSVQRPPWRSFSCFSPLYRHTVAATASLTRLHPRDAVRLVRHFGQHVYVD